jgi:AraC family transcriptional regulator, transcriptional activator of pobA
MDGSGKHLHNSNMSTRPGPTRLPTYQLYGDAGGSGVPERLHVETISSRSRLHDWEIAPHRHEVLFQILYIASGQAEAQVDGRRQALAGPAAVVVPAAAAHGFRFEPGVQGWVVTVQEAHVRQLLASEPGLWSALGARPQVLAWGRAGAGCLRAQGLARDVAQRVGELADEHAGHARWRQAALDAALTRLLLALARALPPDAGGAGGPALPDGHLARYRALVDARFRLQPSVASMAAELGITPTQLNRICRAQLGRGALALLHARMALEAQRQLAYTTQSVKHIALDLGFADPGYFTRFFQRECGLSPTAWRRQAHG